MGKVGAVSETKDFAKVIDVSESEGVSRDEETEDKLMYIIKRMQRRRFQRVNKFQMIMKLSFFVGVLEVARDKSSVASTG